MDWCPFLPAILEAIHSIAKSMMMSRRGIQVVGTSVERIGTETGIESVVHSIELHIEALHVHVS